VEKWLALFVDPHPADLQHRGLGGVALRKPVEPDDGMHRSTGERVRIGALEPLLAIGVLGGTAGGDIHRGARVVVAVDDFSARCFVAVPSVDLRTAAGLIVAFEAAVAVTREVDVGAVSWSIGVASGAG